MDQQQALVKKKTKVCMRQSACGSRHSTWAWILSEYFNVSNFTASASASIGSSQLDQRLWRKETHWPIS